MKSLLLVTTAGAALLGAGAIRAQPAPVAPPAPRQLTFKSAIALSLHLNPSVSGAHEAVGTADAKAAAARARRWAKLDVSFIGNLYTQEYDLMFGPQLFRLYKQYTTISDVTITQPLTGLAYLSALVGAAEHDANATRDDYDRTRLDVAYHTGDAYLRLLEARATALVAHQSVADIQSELDRAEQLRKADVNTDIDVLRFQAAKAAADQTALRADTATETALAALVVQLGLHDGEAIEVTDDLPSPPPPLAMTIEQAQQQALAARPELRAASERVSAATSQTLATKERYLPTISAIGEYQHNTGVQPFQPEDQAYLGIRAQWNLWNWGETRDTIREAEHTRAQASIAEDALVDQVRLEVRQSWLSAKAAYDSLAVAAVQQKAAEEALRLQKVRFDNAAATTTDVLDSQTAATRARLQVTLARYDYYLALVALARSVGDLPDPSR